MRKRALSFLLAAVMVLGIAGCGGSGSSAAPESAGRAPAVPLPVERSSMKKAP